MGGNPSDFFERRDSSKRRTLFLITLFFLAVAATVLAVYLSFQFIISKTGFFGGYHRSVGSFAWDWYWFWRIGALTLAVILGGTVYRLAELMSGGGAAIAKMLGGSEIEPSTRDPLLRRLLNIVEEMSIASGAPAPTVYLLKNEEGINAFAAGLGFEDAIIAVTYGALKRLNREELQGVIAHEFSHVLNGDSKLNIHLMGWLNGIMMISAIGRVIMRASSGGGSGTRRGGVWFGVLFGLILFILGLIGYFFARIIQMAVSRQREYLADASAVQYTRNPVGLAGALKKIGGFHLGAAVQSANAEQAAHLFFGEALTKGFFRLWSTHPPLDERIRLLEPGWKGRFEAPEEVSFADADAVERFLREESVASALGSVDAQSAHACTPEAVAGSVGKPGSEHSDRARQMLAGADRLLLDSARTGGGAMALLCALLLCGDTDVRKKQMLLVERRGGPKLAEATKRIAALLGSHSRQLRLPLLDISLPAIKKLDNVSLTTLMLLIDELIESDAKVEPFEAAARAIVIGRIKKLLGIKTSVKGGDVAKDLSILLGVLAREGGSDEAGAKKAFEAAASELGALGAGVAWPDAESATGAAFEAAALRFSVRSYADKRTAIKAFVAAATEDSRIRVAEAELVRAAAELMGVPVPPIVCDSD